MPEDIFFLTLDEVEEMANSPRSMCEKIRTRRAAFEANKIGSFWQFRLWYWQLLCGSIMAGYYSGYVHAG
jgi:hypothetical protein